MNKKRAMSLVIVAAMIVSLFAGCNNTEKSSTPSVKESSTSASTSEKESSVSSTSSESEGDVGTGEKFDDVKLKMLHCWNGGVQVATDQYNNEVATAIREKIGVTVEFEGIMMKETEKLNLMFASGDMPDIINAPYWGGTTGETAVIKKAGSEGLLADIREKLEQYPDLMSVYELGTVGQKYLDNDINYSEYNGGLYVLPSGIPKGIENDTNWTYGVFVRGDVPAALGVDEKSIKTTDQLYDFMVKARDHGFKDVNENDTIVATTYHEGWDLTGYQQNFKPYALTDHSRGYYLTDDNKVNFSALSDSFIDKNLFIWKLVNENILDKESFKHTDAQADEKVGNGTALFASAQYGAVIKSTQLSGLYDSNPEMRYTWVGPLEFADGTPAAQVRPEGQNGSGVLIFPTSSSNIDAALAYINYINSEEGLMLSQYGIEGEHYDLVDGVPRMNAEWTEKYKADNEGTKEALRAFGIGYIHGFLTCADNKMVWWGEKEYFAADAENEYMKEYKTEKPIKEIKGYAIDGITPDFERFADVSEFAFEGTTDQDYRERSYFAATEAEARQILEDYQEFLRSSNNGVLQEMLDWMTEQYGTRDDLVF